MPECAQVCGLHTQPHLATLRKTETADGWVAIGVSRKTDIMSLTFWLTLLNPMSDGSKHTQQLDRGEINFLSVCCLYASIINSFWNIWMWSLEMVKNSNFFSNFLAHPVETWCHKLQQVFEEQSFGIYTGRHLFSHSFIALSITRCSMSAQKFAVRVGQVTTVAMATTQLVLYQFKNLLWYQLRIE